VDILVNKDRFQLRYGSKIYTVGIGILACPTPTGLFRIYAKERDPFQNWEVGTRWMDFHAQEERKNRYPPGSYRKLSIHGIGDPDLIGTRCTLGCVALCNEDVEELYDLACKGDKVLIFSEADARDFFA